MVRRFVFACLCLVAFTTLYSQHSMQLFTGVGLKYKLMENSASVHPGINGSSLELGITRATARPISISASVETGAGGVSNYLSLHAGIVRPCLTGNGRIEITPGIHVIQGVGLFKPYVLYLWGLEENNFIAYRFDKGSALGMVIGFRLYAFPGYSDYSSVHRFLDLNMGIRFRFR